MINATTERRYTASYELSAEDIMMLTLPWDASDCETIADIAYEHLIALFVGEMRALYPGVADNRRDVEDHPGFKEEWVTHNGNIIWTFQIVEEGVETGE